MTGPFEVTLAVCLPRDAVGIRLVRRVTETALSALTVAAEAPAASASAAPSAARSGSEVRGFM